MSVRTVADDQLIMAKENLKQTIRALSEIVINQCDGASEYSEEYKLTMRSSLAQLIEIRDSLCH